METALSSAAPPPVHVAELITSIDELASLLPAITQAQAALMRRVVQRYRFRLPRFYVEKVLHNDPADPLWELALPAAAELADAGTERWDTFQLPERAVDHPRWIQKYRYEALLRTTDYCSGLCRYCYLKNRDVTPGVISEHEIDAIFDAAEVSPCRHSLREIILSGGDPLAISADRLEYLAQRLQRLDKTVSRRITVNIHTREPVWNPHRLLSSVPLQRALARLAPSTYVLHVVHPREVTPELHQALELLVRLGGSRRPVLLVQHPLFKTINADAAVITRMYDLLDSGNVVVRPYYLIHPFPDGTLPAHRLTLPESQRILCDLASAPGTRVPLLTVPTPMGKCVIGPYEELVDRGGFYLLHTKDGVPVRYTMTDHYNPAEERLYIPTVSAPHRATQAAV